MAARVPIPALNRTATESLAGDVRSIQTGESPYKAARSIAHEYLGARPIPACDSGSAPRTTARVAFGFWVPGIDRGRLGDRIEDFALEVFTAAEQLVPGRLGRGEPSEVAFSRVSIPLMAIGEYLVCVADDVLIGSRNACGALYWLVFQDGATRRVIRDPFAASLPFGVYAPAEVFDVASMLASRKDIDYFRTHNRARLPDGSLRARDVGVHLEIHPETATDAGTIAALTRRYREIGSRIQKAMDAGAADIYEELTPADRNFVAFDSVELTPEVPPAEREDAPGPTGEFFAIADSEGDSATITLRRPDISNWGYDTPILGSAAINPSILETLRPNEFLEFVETLHTMPGGPIQLCIDSVLGHCDFQGARLLETFDVPPEESRDLRYLNSAYLRGANMYGRDIDFSRAEVKALLLELLERKLEYGFDAVRVDGAQDFIRERDPETGLRIQDDEFLNEMANLVVGINGIVWRPDFNLEDGRPWPDDLNWLYNSKYLDHTIERTLPYGDRVKQWSPIIFAHNVHGKFKWFYSKWDRFVEVFRYGENWITGHSNHDNARYFYRMTEMRSSREYVSGDPFDAYYNDYLGETMPEAAHNALDNPALSAVSLAFLPGNPMFLLNALFHTPWTFMRDIDATYDVKIAAEEGSRYFAWYVDSGLYDDPGFFVRLKKLGFATHRSLVAPLDEKEHHPGFADRLYTLRTRVKTDALMARFLYDDPNDEGGYENAEELMRVVTRLRTPAVRSAHWQAMEERIARDPRESARRVAVARTQYEKTIVYLRRQLERVVPERRRSLQIQIDKLEFLLGLAEDELALLVEDADSRDDYDPERWSTDTELVRRAPEQIRSDGRVIPGALRRYARAFMLDAKDAATVSRFENQVDPDRTAYNLSLRRFRRERPWLPTNATNDARRDYFARKLFTNGAKDTGEWSDKGDLVNCNTIYYGWRTSPDGAEQIFVIANMEGAPIERCPLSLFLNLAGTWRVEIASPTMDGLPPQVDRNYVISDFRNGEAMVLTRRPRSTT